jgi:hypothetical protein
VLPQVYESYATHVLRSFGAVSSEQLFLYLKHDEPSALAPALAALRPARVRVVPRHVRLDLVPNSSCVSPSFSWREKWYQARALRWWGALNSSWAMIREWEREHAMDFGRVFLSRPDLLYQHSFGPSCLYDRKTWYTGGLGGPDWLWLLPRRLAAVVLGGTAHALLHCSASRAPGSCCQLQHSAHAANMAKDERHEDGFIFSYWPMAYWRLMHNITLSTRLAGRAHLMTQPPDGGGFAPHPGLAAVGCGAPNCGQRNECIDEWRGVSWDGEALVAG